MTDAEIFDLVGTAEEYASSRVHLNQSRSNAITAATWSDVRRHLHEAFEGLELIVDGKAVAADAAVP